MLEEGNVLQEEKKERSYLTPRSILIGIPGLCIVTFLSMYVALKMGALPWPTVFVTVLSSVLLRKARGSGIQEINCTHTLMSAGAMVAGGLAFTLPGLWIINPNADMSLSTVMIIAVTGAILGTLFINLNRHSFIVDQKLPYPIGQSAYNTLVAASNGKGAVTMFSSIGFSAVFSYIRDALGKIPQVLVLYGGSLTVPPLMLYVSPMALGIGAIIGPALTAMWLAGMVLGYYVVTPLGIGLGWFADMSAADAFRSSLGIGLMIGTGLGVAIKAAVPFVRSLKVKRTGKDADIRTLMITGGACIASVALLTIFTEMTVLQGLLMIPGVYLATYLSGMLTGQTGINPMEIFAILVLLFVGALTGTTLGAAFAIAGTVAVAAGISGDVMNDFKCGAIAGTPPKDQLKAEAIGGIIGAVIAALALYVLKNNYTLGGPDFPAPQAKAVAAMAQGLSNPLSFWIGLGIGLVLFLLNVPAATLGLGVYLSTSITLSVGLGSLVIFIAKRIFRDSRTDSVAGLIASGFLGGEGLAGIAIALLAMLG